MELNGLPQVPAEAEEAVVSPMPDPIKEAVMAPPEASTEVVGAVLGQRQVLPPAAIMDLEAMAQMGLSSSHIRYKV
jgi:hypothetical protein